MGAPVRTEQFRFRVDRNGSTELLERTRWCPGVNETAIETWEQVSSNPDPEEDLGYDPEYDLESGFRHYINVLRKENGLDPV